MPCADYYEEQKFSNGQKRSHRSVYPTHTNLSGRGQDTERVDDQSEKANQFYLKILINFI
jgi:hypothetical protein